MLKAIFETNRRDLQFDLTKPVDISIPIRHQENVNAFYLPSPAFRVVREGDFIGSVAEGGNCNCSTVSLNPHGNGTHTECLGHISQENIYIEDCLKDFHFLAVLVTVELEAKAAEKVVSLENLTNSLPVDWPGARALIIRTLPNDKTKLNRRYSGTNPPYIQPDAAKWVGEHFKHLLVDLPSIDQEDDPQLTGHHLFWNYPEKPFTEKTITELIYVPDKVKDGFYLLNLQVAALEMDASPSRPVLFTMI